MAPFHLIPRPRGAIDAWVDGLRDGDVILHARGGRVDERRSYRFRAPERVLALEVGGDVIAFLSALDAALASGRAVAGWLSYEAGASLLGLRPRPAPEPLAWFGVYDRGEVVEGAAPIAAAGDPPGAEPGLVGATLMASVEDYGSRVDRVRAYLSAGDAYQVNLTTALLGRVPDVRRAYRALSAAQGVAYGALIDAAGVQIASVSPESFVRIDAGPAGLRLTARPMKGTTARAADPDADRAAAEALAADPKTRAENVMIVDLLRNDLGRVALPGSVRVVDLFTAERYPTLWQLTSTVRADAPRDTPLSAILAALFPCGSITGAPKRRAMEIIDALEGVPRGVYTGAIGFALPDARGRLQRGAFSVAIRTLEVRDGVGRVGVGAGVLVDSDPVAEFEEVRLKGRFATRATPPLALIETMRAHGTRLLRWPLHWARLDRSAAALGVPIDRGEVEAAVEAALGRANAPLGAVRVAPVWRVRLEIREDGLATARAHAHVDDLLARVAWSAVPVRSDDLARRHKTGDRAVYDRATAWARERGLADVLFVNEAGRVAEGAISTVFTLGPHGVWLTPPIADGALPGVLRADWLAHGFAVEAPLTPADVRASVTLIGNALRGVRRVVWSDEGPFSP